MEKKQKRIALVLFPAAAFLLMLGYAQGLAHIEGLLKGMHLSFLFAALFAGVLAAYNAMERPGLGRLCFAGGFVFLSLMARFAMLDFNSADYDSFLRGWVEIFRQGGFAMLGQNIGDYNLLYQYILLLISRSPLFDLYMIKYVTIVFDYLLALSMLRAAGIFAGRQARTPVFLILCILPTTLLDGACWGQCDSVYAFLVIMSLCDLKTRHPWRSAVFLALAFAFKLQTIFFFPVVLLALLHGEYKPWHALAFAAAYLVTMIPALAAGRPFLDALSVYANQSMGQYYHRLTYNAPNLYAFFPMLEFASSQEYTWMRYIEGIDGKMTNLYLNEDLFPMLQHAALYACILLVLAAVIYWLRHREEITPDMTLNFALFFAIFLPFVMPKIHDRYFYLADMLSILYAARRPDRRFVAPLTVGASLMSYMAFLTRQRPVDERVLALMMLASLAVTARDLLTDMRKNRLKGGTIDATA